MFIRVRNPRTGREFDVLEGSIWLRPDAGLEVLDRGNYPPHPKPRRAKNVVPHKGVELAGPVEVSAEDETESEEG